MGGHQRAKVLVQLGAKEIDCVVVEMNEDKEKALNIALNKVSGDWDVPLLTDLLKDLDTSGFDVSLTGFDIAELNELFGEPDTKEDDFDEDEALAEIETPITKLGDVWLLGKHRLICGDSTATDDISILMKFDKPHRNGEHPTMKPVGLCGYFIANSSKEGDIVLDPFGGSGSTLIACEQTGRTCYTSGIDPKYYDVIVKRYA